MLMNRQSGFTLIELVIALAVAGILLGIGVPSFSSAIQNSRISSQYNQAVRAFFLARSEAVKASQFVVICPRSEPASLECGDETDWANGSIVFVDAGADVDDDASIDGDDTIISTEPEFSGDNTISVVARPANGGETEAVAHIRYQPRGNTNWGGASVIVCDSKRGSEYSKVVNIRLTGDIQPGRPNGDEKIPRDAFNKAIDCGAGS